MKRLFRRSDIRADADRDVSDELRFHIDLTHLRTRAAAGAQPGARSPPSTAAPVARGANRSSRRPTASTAPLQAP
jgi:hypothetical protein